MFVLPVRKGGLGNQLFQVAAGVIYAEETGRLVLLPDEHYNTHNPLKQDYATTIFSGFKQRIQKPIDETAIQKLREQEFSVYPGEPGFEDWKVDHSILQNLILHGYFQNYPPIARHERLIRDTFKKGILPYLNQFPPTNRVAIHVRRGDYLLPPWNTVHYTLTEDYYRKAIANIKMDECEGFSIFSDDIEWCKNEWFKDLHQVEFIDEPDEVRSLAQMIQCKGGVICANSSFSWWGAFLGAYELKKPCIVPSTWFKGGVGNLFPSEWICI